MAYGNLLHSSDGHLVNGLDGHLVFKTEVITVTGAKGYHFQGYSTGTEGTITTRQSAALSQFNSDSVMDNSYTTYEEWSVARRTDGLYKNYGYSDTCHIHAGYSKLTIPAGGKTGLSRVSMSFVWRSSKGTEWTSLSLGGGLANPYDDYFALKIAFSESASTYANGAALAAMTPLMTLDAINMSGTVVVDVDKALIEGMTGSDLYVWMYVLASPDVPSYWSSSTDTNGTAIHASAGVPTLTIRK